MNAILLIQIMIYDLIDVSICVFLALAPFTQQLCSRKKQVLLGFLLYTLVVLSRIMSLLLPMSTLFITFLRPISYLLLFRLAIPCKLPRLLFVLTVVLNYASFVYIAFNFLANALFAQKFRQNPYSIQSSLLMTGTFLFCAIPIYYMMDKKIQPLIISSENKKLWDYLWLVPTTFSIIYHYNILANGGIIAYSIKWQNVAFSLILTAGSFFVTFLTIKLVEENNSNLQLKIENHYLAMQTHQYENFKNRMEETRRARHDLRHNMALIKFYADNHNFTGLSEYIQKYFSTLPKVPDSPIIYCENYALNAVILYYAELAREFQIKFSADIQYPSSSGIQDTDIVVLYGNLLENAVEACRRQTVNPIFIRLRTLQKSGSIIIVVDNSYDGTIQKSEDGFLSSKGCYIGIGITSTQKIAQKYHGMAKFEYDENVFFASVILNTPFSFST